MTCMVCSICGGMVTWRGPLSALTHTQCESCGERNCQVVADDDDGDEPHPGEELSEQSMYEAAGGLRPWKR